MLCRCVVSLTHASCLLNSYFFITLSLLKTTTTNNNKGWPDMYWMKLRPSSSQEFADRLEKTTDPGRNVFVPGIPFVILCSSTKSWWAWMECQTLVHRMCTRKRFMISWMSTLDINLWIFCTRTRTEDWKVRMSCFVVAAASLCCTSFSYDFYAHACVLLSLGCRQLTQVRPKSSTMLIQKKVEMCDSCFVFQLSPR